MALQMDQPLSGDLANLGVLASVKLIVAGLDPVDRVKA